MLARSGVLSAGRRLAVSLLIIGVALGVDGRADAEWVLTTSVDVPSAIETGGALYGFADAIDGLPGGVRAEGWAFATTADEQLGLGLEIDGQIAFPVTHEHVSRPDVVAAIPAVPPAAAPHVGFELLAPAAAGPHRVCVVAFANTANQFPIGCEEIDVTPAAPIGAVEVLEGRPGAVFVSGWAAGGGEAAWLRSVDVQVDGAPAGVVVPRFPRPDITQLRPELPIDSGLREVVAATPGFHEVCVVASPYVGEPTVLGCGNVEVSTGEMPTGGLDTVAVDGDSITVSGQAIDPDSPGAELTVEIEVAGTPVRYTASNVQGDYVALLDRSTITASVDDVEVCAVAVDPQSAYRVWLGCSSSEA